MKTAVKRFDRNECHWCGEPTKPGRKFCGKECRQAMKDELQWDCGTIRRLPRFWLRQYIVYAVPVNWKGITMTMPIDVHVRGFQKRAFLHE